MLTVLWIIGGLALYFLVAYCCERFSPPVAIGGLMLILAVFSWLS